MMLHPNQVSPLECVNCECSVIHDHIVFASNLTKQLWQILYTMIVVSLCKVLLVLIISGTCCVDNASHCSNIFVMISQLGLHHIHHMWCFLWHTATWCGDMQTCEQWSHCAMKHLCVTLSQKQYDWHKLLFLSWIIDTSKVLNWLSATVIFIDFWSSISVHPITCQHTINFSFNHLTFYSFSMCVSSHTFDFGLFASSGLSSTGNAFQFCSFDSPHCTRHQTSTNYSIRQFQDWFGELKWVNCTTMTQIVVFVFHVFQMWQRLNTTKTQDWLLKTTQKPQKTLCVMLHKWLIEWTWCSEQLCGFDVKWKNVDECWWTTMKAITV